MYVYRIGLARVSVGELGLFGHYKTKYPKVEIFGHRDFSSKACPSFDATKEYENITNMW